MRTLISRTRLRSGMALLLCLGLFSCSKQSNQEPTTEEIPGFNVEQAFPGQRGPVVTAYINGMAVAAEKIANVRVLEGDIMLDPEDARATTEGAGVLSKYWPSATVYYSIDTSITAAKKTKILNAIAHWEANTILRFKERTTETNYVWFAQADGCSSYIGMIGGRQKISMGDGCSTGNMIHEIGHAIGLYHEHTRADRDNYVVVHWENIESGEEHNYNQYTTGFDNGAFDFGSIMLYSSTSFSSNGSPTLTKLDGSTFTGQRSALSAGDLATVTVMYPTPTSNAAPTVSLTAPAAGATYTAPASITLSATASDADGTVQKVDFYNGTTKIATDSVAPYSYTWTGVAAGTYALKAIATDNGGATATTASVTVTVNSTSTSSCNGIPAYSPSTIYATPGIQVSYQGMVFENKWWIQGTAPDKTDTYGPWKFIKNCE